MQQKSEAASLHLLDSWRIDVKNIGTVNKHLKPFKRKETTTDFFTRAPAGKTPSLYQMVRQEVFLSAESHHPWG